MVSLNFHSRRTVSSTYHNYCRHLSIGSPRPDPEHHPGILPNFHVTPWKLFIVSAVQGCLYCLWSPCRLPTLVLSTILLYSLGPACSLLLSSLASGSADDQAGLCSCRGHGPPRALQGPPRSSKVLRECSDYSFTMRIH